jgi:signal transduction histidine kinase
MQERVAVLNGNLKIESTPNCGCSIDVSLPL